MSSILRINSITSRSGINTLDFTGNGFSYVTDVGFGTTNPRGKLDVQGTFLANGGNAGIGTTLPTSRLDVVGDVQVSGVVTATSFRGDGSNLTGVAATSNIKTNAIVNSGVTTVSAGTTAIPSISPSGDPNTGIFFPEADTIAIAEGGVEAARIDDSSRVLVGLTASASTDNNANFPKIQLEGIDGDASRLLIRSNAGTTSTAGPILYLARSRGTTSNSKTAVVEGDFLGSIIFEGTDGATDRRAAAITAFVDNGVSTNDMPGRLVFSTSPDGTSDPTERLRITSSGNVGVGLTNPDEILCVTKNSPDPFNTVSTHLKLINGAGNSGAGNRIQFVTGAATPWIQSLISGANSANGSDLVFGTPSTGTVGTERIRITSTGDFNITQTPGRYSVDVSPGATSIANGGTVDFISASGMLVANNWSNGNVTIYICGGGTVTTVANTGSAVGSFAYNAGIAGYRWTNNYGSTAIFGFFFVRTRTTA